jgi:hypothetical protein
MCEALEKFGGHVTSMKFPLGKRRELKSTI